MYKLTRLILPHRASACYTVLLLLLLLLPLTYVTAAAATTTVKGTDTRQVVESGRSCGETVCMLQPSAVLWNDVCTPPLRKLSCSVCFPVPL
jgi:hypothetical protein